MIEIIKVGWREEPKHKTTCGKCLTEFTYQHEDLERDREGAYVKCPTCSGFISHLDVVTPHYLR
jgi:DNA-directed RNA polymerase subunit RPC12/RpoP